MDGKLRLVSILLNRKYDECLRVILEIPGQLHNLLLGISMDVFGQLNFLFTVLKLHNRQLLSYNRSSGTA